MCPITSYSSLYLTVFDENGNRMVILNGVLNFRYSSQVLNVSYGSAQHNNVSAAPHL